MVLCGLKWWPGKRFREMREEFFVGLEGSGVDETLKVGGWD
jgi:hypothetical protein